MLYFK